MSEIAVIVLAAGTSSRAGSVNKLLSSYKDKPMVAHVVEAATRLSGCPVYVVVGHQADKVRAALSRFDLNFIENPDFDQGMSTSLIRGIKALPPSITGALICLGDMPRIEVQHLQQLISVCTGADSLCVPMYQGKQGNPVLWGRDYFDDILTLDGDVGAKSLIKKHTDIVKCVEMPDDAVLFDIDHP